jgi:nitrous oxidase accessory protein
LKKKLTSGIVILFVLMISTSTTATKVYPSYRQHANDSSILYVGGTGLNNYTTIQAAITNSTEGDTVFVYDHSSPYYEHIIVDKSLHLIGENQTTTIIDGENTGDVVIFSANNITMSGFTVQHSGDTPKVDAGIESRSNGNEIYGNSILQNGQYAVGILLNESSDVHVHDNYIAENGNEGIFLEKSTNCVIENNEFTRNGHCAIVISISTANLICHNIMHENYAGVSIWPESTENTIAYNFIRNQEYSGIGIWPGANHNNIHDNYLSNNSLYGCIITHAQETILMNNTIWGSDQGIRLLMANLTTIQSNNFIDNTVSAYFENSTFNRWKRNYWDDSLRIGPKCIWGKIRIPWNKTIVIRWINLDWFPTRTPYDIPIVWRARK